MKHFDFEVKIVYILPKIMLGETIVMKLNFKISRKTYSKIHKYSESLNIKIPTTIRLLLFEGINLYYDYPNYFKKKYDECKYKPSFGTANSYYGNIIEPKRYSIEVSDYIYNGVQKIKDEYLSKTNEVINNIILFLLNDKFRDISKDNAGIIGTYKKDRKQYVIPLSEIYTEKLDIIADLTGIKKNQLMAFIISNYLINNYSKIMDNSGCENSRFLW